MTQQHYDRFMQLVDKRRDGRQCIDPLDWEWSAALYLLSCKPDIFRNALRFVGRDGFAYDKMLKLSPYENFDTNVHFDLVRLAVNLFTGNTVKGLDCSNFCDYAVGYATTAMLIRAVGPEQYIKLDS